MTNHRNRAATPRTAKAQPSTLPNVASLLEGMKVATPPAVEQKDEDTTTQDTVGTNESALADETNATADTSTETIADVVVEDAPEQVGINSGLPKSLVEAAASVLTTSMPGHRERGKSEREAKLQAAMNERAARTANPVTTAVAEVITPKKKNQDATASPEVKTAYELIDKVLDVYLDTMEPGKFLSDADAAAQQLALYRLVKSVLTKGGPTMRHSMTYILMIIKANRSKAFAETYALRGLRGMRGTEAEVEFWRLLLEALVAFCEPEGIALRMKRIDLPRLNVAAQRIEGANNTTIAGNLAVFLTQHLRSAKSNPAAQ